MQQNAVTVWRQKWDSMNGTDFDKAMELLFTYACSFRHLPLIDIKHVWGGQLGRFFSAKFNYRYGDIVQQTLGTFYNQDAITCVDDQLSSVVNLISALKSNFATIRLNPHDDLHTILTVIAEKTGVDFATVDSQIFDNACRHVLNPN